ncbi:MAG: polysaccharide biosynthesis protein [Verrucomicrobia bacterium]|nr:polysaccharide biosynthesis protein [Verrucomicrobiota bacterium]
MAGAYVAIISASFYYTYELRFDFKIPQDQLDQILTKLAIVLPLKLVLLFVFGQFGVLLSYFRLPDVYRILFAMGIAAAVLWFVLPLHLTPPRTVIIGDFMLSFLSLITFRTSLRVLNEKLLQVGASGNAPRQRRVAIVGAGQTGSSIAYDLISRKALGMRPVVFLDDDPGKIGRQMHGIPVVDTPDSLEFVKSKYGIDTVILAMSNASAKRIADINTSARELGLKVEIVPSLTELSTGKVKASRIRPVEIIDLLGREPVELDSQQIASMIGGKVILVTGGGGSIGSEICRQVMSYNPKRLVVIDQCEVLLYHIETNLREAGYDADFTCLVADVLDRRRMEQIFTLHKPQVIFHAAAHKHVPIMERQPAEAIKNNTIGTAAMADLAYTFNSERFVLISTDKAINPTNAMGASKRLAEIYIQSKFLSDTSKTKFMAVRFGNVLGSSGSVVPAFTKQIAAGGPVTVTHPEITRYFMTIPEAVGLVLQCGTLGKGGEIFVLDMGQPIKIVDLARQMIALSGYTVDKDIEIKFTGLRPGEKLYEELKHNDERHTETPHPRIFRFEGNPYAYEQVIAFLNDIKPTLDTADRNTIKRKIQDFARNTILTSIERVPTWANVSLWAT